MTQEEAIKKIKWEMAEQNIGKDVRIALETLIPELAESEDERIIKTLQEYVENRNWNLNGPTQGEVLAWLEKQKENPKSTDSIPSDCVSDAKCEDRWWHKVTDSLPDNQREVMCKDKAGNYFIGRYYVGEGWSTYNYGEEDRPYHLNSPVSKWIDFPSEKQKEQKPAEWSEEDGRMLSRCVKSIEISKQFADSNTFNEAKDKEISWLKSLPERLSLRPKQEWSEEDEKIIERLTGILAAGSKGFHADYTKEGYAEVLSWLKSLPLNLKKKNEDVARLCSNEWSEEDMECYNSISNCLQNQYVPDSKRIKCLYWFKSLRSKFHWKPSEEQMNALEECGECKRCIKELCEQLKKS